MKYNQHVIDCITNTKNKYFADVVKRVIPSTVYRFYIEQCDQKLLRERGIDNE